MDQRLAVLIDGENISAKHFHSIAAYVGTLGICSDRRVFADFSDARQSDWLDICRQGLIKPELQLSGGTGKNSTDIALVICAMDLCHSNMFDGLVIVSNDRDFVPLVWRLRQSFLPVHGIGTKQMDDVTSNVYSSYHALKVESLSTVHNKIAQISVPKTIPRANNDSIFYSAVDRLLSQQPKTLSQIGTELRTSAPELLTILGKGKLKKLILSEPRLNLNGNLVERRKK